eukprot:2745158-Alexandrium_andersonii.AAC.1
MLPHIAQVCYETLKGDPRQLAPRCIWAMILVTSVAEFSCPTEVAALVVLVASQTVSLLKELPVPFLKQGTPEGLRGRGTVDKR